MMGTGPASGSGLLWRTRRFGEDFTPQDWSLLPDYERARAAAIGHRAARTRFVVGRALLRRSITERLPHLDARSYHITVAPSGRPSLVEHPDVDISLSHTVGLAVAVVSSVGPVGIDVEPSGRSDFPRIDCWLTRLERHQVEARPPGARNHRLLASWVAKGAVLKACDHLGTVTRRRIEVRRSHDDPVEAITTATGPSATADVLSYQLHGAYLMAIAIHVQLHPTPWTVMTTDPGWRIPAQEPARRGDDHPFAPTFGMRRRPREHSRGQDATTVSVPRIPAEA